MADGVGGNVATRTQAAEHIGPGYTGDNIEAKRVANYEWSEGAQDWQRLGSGSTARYDVEGTIIYVGSAAPGSAESDAVWSVTKFDLTDMTAGSGKVASGITWADRTGATYV